VRGKYLWMPKPIAEIPWLCLKCGVNFMAPEECFTEWVCPNCGSQITERDGREGE
jgi:predicted RNA-binding Zn-ribbon protein involved in translation (DUF1610 family)